MGEGDTASASHPHARLWTWVAWSAGAGLCLAQYLARPSLWVDELAIVRNLRDRGLGDLVSTPLDFDQIAPVGFLLMQKGVVSAVGASEFALRAFPLLMALVALAVVAALGRALLPGWGSAVPVFLLGTSAQAIWLSSQVKQYSTDLAATAALLLVAVTTADSRDHAGWRRATLLLGIIAPWLSQPSVFSLAAAALALLLDDWRRVKRLSPGTWVTLGAWGISATLSLTAARARVTPETMAFMREYWAKGFMPLPPRDWNDLKWPAHTLRLLVQDVVNGGWSYSYLAIATVGGWIVWRRSRSTAVVLFVPVVAALGASAIGQYPLMDRLAFFLAPVVVVLLGAGIAGIAQWMAVPRWARAAVVVVLISLPLGMLAYRPPPYSRQHTRQLVETLAREWRAGDRLYVTYGGWQAWTHYAPTAGLADADVIVGACRGADVAAYDRDVDRLRGARRAWILFVPAGRLQDDAGILRRANTLGPRDRSWIVHDRDVGGAVRSVALHRFTVRAAAEGEARAVPPIAPPHADCRGAAVDRRLDR